MYQNYDASFYSQNEVKKSVVNSYLWMAVGLVVTGAVSFGLYSSGFFLTLLTQMPFLAFVLLIAQIVLVVSFSSQLARNTSASTMKILFLLYAVTLGFSMTSIFYAYSDGVIFIAFMVSALYFLCLALIGITTKKDMSRIGTICFTGLFAMIISQLLLGLFGIGMDTRLMCLVGLLLFTGITVWDIQRMNKIMTLNDGSIVSREKLSIYFALELYLDFINIFLYILQLLGMGNSKD